ncbi:sensor histidine kinase [Labedaea rhizosphaerae]|uniref:Two-component system sensor histidine kinase DesK n=1 Tax=Labedaea rhizosphaerae TaxID=598644 RepID=A0A4R6S8R8_LABRH|nr:histidine kinase [Labedaea rhizosphaerae]TDP96171.1 two-component system sensor histidine kinase DesK [Labedaea rhizosphaerae]
MQDDPQRWVYGWRRFVLDAGLLVYPAIVGVNAVQDGRALPGLLLVGAFCVVYGLAVVMAVRLNPVGFWPAVGVLLALFVVALPVVHGNAIYLLTVVLAVTAPALDEWAPIAVAAGALVGILAPLLWGEDPAWAQTVALIFTVLVVYVFAEAIRANRALVEARAEVARLASDAERNRIARDLHDLLGHSLTAITIKSDLARHIAEKESSQALGEISDVERLARQALTDVRAAVSGYREVTLAGELARGRELLRASGVTADLPTAVDVVDAGRQELFGWAVREGLTNVARHARATRCTVTITPSEVEIRDDGIGGIGGVGSDGNGLAGLRERVTAAGGTVEAGPAEPRGWRLRVVL